MIVELSKDNIVELAKKSTFPFGDLAALLDRAQSRDEVLFINYDEDPDLIRGPNRTMRMFLNKGMASDPEIRAFVMTEEAWEGQ